MVSIVRTLALVALSAAALGAGLDTGQARGFRLRGSIFHQSPRASVVRQSVAAAPAHDLVTREARAQSPATTGAVDSADPVGQPQIADTPTPIPARPSVPEAAPIPKAAEPWCRSGRIAGAGEGFCLIN